MEQDSPSQDVQWFGPDVRQGTLLGVLLGILFALVFYFGYGSPTLNIINEQNTLLLDYAGLIFLLSSVVGLLRGRVTGSEASGVKITICACLAQALTTFVLNSLLSLLVSTSFAYLFGYADDSRLAGVFWGVCAAGVILLQMMVGIAGAAFGGLIGSRLLRR